MICSWCNGTGKECGCKEGYCLHCNKGEVANPPFGPIVNSYTEELDILSQEQMDTIIDNFKKTVHEQIAFIPVYMEQHGILSEQEIKSFQDYWDNPYRNENLGQVLNRVAWLIENKILQTYE